METIVYRCPGPFQRPGGTYNTLGIRSEEALSKALSEGWFQTLPEAIEGKALEPEKPVVVVATEIPADDAPPTRAELEAKATELRIKFDGRTSDRKLGQLISSKLG